MDYLQIYKVQFDSSWLKIKNNTIEELKTAKESKKKFNKVFNRILEALKDAADQIYDEISSDNLNSCIILFRDKYSEYDNNLENDEIVSLSLNNEVKKEFNACKKNDYESFVKKLAKLDSINEIQNHFRNYNNYYESIYELDRYDYFYGKRFESISYENSEEYKDMLNIKYPEKQIQSSISDPLYSYKHTEINLESVKEKDNNIRDIIKNEFDTKERAVLIHLIKSRLKTTELTHLVKLCLIIGATDKFEIFEVKSASKSYLYKQAHKGYTVFKINELESKISSLKMKLKNRGLNSIAEELQVDFSIYFNKNK